LTVFRTSIEVVPYDPGWGRTFEALRRVLLRALGEIAADVEHVGSTAVPDLAAKPVIDLDVVVPSRDALATALSGLAALGYRHEGDLGVPGREAFARDASDVPRDGSGRSWPAHHLYVCASDSPELRRHLRFRDWLRRHSAAAEEYGRLKRRLAAVHRFDRDAYARAKSEFIETALRSLEEAPRGFSRSPRSACSCPTGSSFRAAIRVLTIRTFVL
jgi:GrpB-like predicted nucleotidyltransferase (UPF0157 family)